MSTGQEIREMESIERFFDRTECHLSTCCWYKLSSVVACEEDLPITIRTRCGFCGETIETFLEPYDEKDQK